MFEDKAILKDTNGFIAQLDTKTSSLSERINWQVEKLVHLTNDILLVLSRSNLRLVIFGGKGIKYLSLFKSIDMNVTWKHAEKFFMDVCANDKGQGVFKIFLLEVIQHYDSETDDVGRCRSFEIDLNEIRSLLSQ